MIPIMQRHRTVMSSPYCNPYTIQNLSYIVGMDPIHLKGNHEDFLLRFLEDATIGPVWLNNGGTATLVSYGVGLGDGVHLEDRVLHAQAGLSAALPRAHKTFLEGLALMHEEGDYVFVHAGIRPGVPLERQAPLDLMWIREEFLASRATHPKVVVHGHSITFTPETKPNRIGIDTGAYATGTLTALVLERTKRDFLHTL